MRVDRRGMEVAILDPTVFVIATDAIHVKMAIFDLKCPAGASEA